MSILSFIGDLFTPAVSAVDKLVTSDAERLELRNALEKIKSDVITKMIEYDQKVLELQGKVVEANANVAIAEVKSESAFARLYRPIIISCMFVLIALNQFGLLKIVLPDLFIQIFGTAFGVITIAPTLTKASSALIDKLSNNKDNK